MLVLASQSATRKTLLNNAGLRFETRPARVDERALESRFDQGEKRAVALALAKAKAEEVSATNPDALVIGADQTLECAGLDVHKPQSRADANAQLWQLRGRSHALHAAVALARRGRAVWHTCDTAHLEMAAFSQADLDRVLDLEEDRILGSVGGYRLEGPSVRLFTKVSGDYFTVLGLPLLPLLAALREMAPELM